MKKEEHIRIAILDMYLGTSNEGMRGIRELIEAFSREVHVPVSYQIFDIRGSAEVPGTEFDAYISTGGPGSPIESQGSLWEQRYFELMDVIRQHNRVDPENKKHVFLICHSFQVFCRYYGYGLVSRRKSTSFGVMTCHKTEDGEAEPLFRGLPNPFWVVDSRDFQITQPATEKVEADGGSILCIEKLRPHIDLERAVMAIRFDEAFVGTQFHPEADAAGMQMYLLRDDKREFVMERYGEKKYREMLEHLDDPDKIMLTHNSVLPRFLNMALKNRLSEVHS